MHMFLSCPAELVGRGELKSPEPRDHDRDGGFLLKMQNDVSRVSCRLRSSPNRGLEKGYTYMLWDF